ncbi:hypothetical protein V6L77_01115 [Pannonibacter sp. Pt2-lr]
MAGIELTDIARSYGGKRVVDGVSLTVNDGNLLPFSAPPAAARPPCCG